MTNIIPLVHKELSYEIIGALFEVFNELGYGYQEKYYEMALAKVLSRKGLKYLRQIKCDLIFENNKIGKYYLDFLIENKIVLEIKVGKRFTKQAFDQIIAYLKATNKKLGILALFTSNGIRFIRILNLNNKINTSESEIKLGGFRKLLKY
ncbi:MAG: GxxExxY protein [Candidatus Parcubacteria bacterium]|nr:GxxExxY protein [Candidatus Parcubacteria bacterium]